MGKATAAAWIACLLCIWAAIHEWLYHQQHRYHSGPSLTIAALAVAGALLAAALIWGLSQLEQMEAMWARDRLAAFKAPTGDERP